MELLRVNNCAYIELSQIKDDKDGVLSIAENRKQIPFDLQRIYYIYNLKDKEAIRGKHAHKHNQQVLFCINGSFILELDDGVNSQEIILDHPNIGVHMDTKVWHTMRNFSDNCILLVLASDLYDADDYIRDYNEFLEYVR